MPAIILSAGLVSRMGYSDECNIKAMTLINNKPLFQITLENLKHFGVLRVIIVIGHKAEYIRNYFGSAYEGIEIEYIFNHEHKTKNNIYSVWLCREHLKTVDTFIIDKDVIFENLVLEKMNKTSANVRRRF